MDDLNKNSIQTEKTPLSRREQRKLKRRNRKRIKQERWESRSFPNKVLTVLWRMVIAAALIYGAMVLALNAFMRSDTYRKLAGDAYDALAQMSDGTFRLLSNTQFLDKDDKVIGEVDSGSYTYVTIDQIPSDLQNAYITIEDKNYKVHQGVDYTAIIRATWELIKHKGEITQGGSTITQQVIKNNLLTADQTFSRKFTEILLAPKLEKKYNKAEIMEFYCNSNYYGNGCYGVQSASKFYFDKDCRELNLAECAMMAGISQSPNKNNPVADYDRAKKKMTTILYRMLKQDYISREDYEAALDTEITITQSEASLVSSNNYMCSFAMHYTTLELMKQDGFKLRYHFKKQEDYDKYREAYEKEYTAMASKIREGGYTIRTSFDQKVQKTLQKQINKTLSGSAEKSRDGKYQLQSAGVCYDNKTGLIVAAVGGRGDSYNRAFLARRQPGSSIKPLLVYTPALNEGSTQPSAIVDDHRIYAVSGDKDSYSPQNANGRYLGRMTVREALARSTNTVAFQLYSPDYIDYLAEMEFSSLVPADNSALSLCLGGFTYGVTVSDMARGYATLANGGISPEKTCLISVTHEKDGTIYDVKKVKPKKIYEHDAAFMMTDMMEGVFMERYGTCYGLKTDDQIVAGKTGTTNSNRDAWLCGYTPYYTTAVWVGREDNAVLDQGSDYSKAIFSGFMTNIHKGKSPKDFRVPDPIQYRQIKNGQYTKTVYDKKKLNMSRRSYLRRPSGYEYYSKKLAEHKGSSPNQGQKAALAEAKKAVSAFEKYQITDIDSALGFEAAYSKAYKMVDALPDSADKTKLLERLQKQYETLEELMLSSWQQLIKEEEEADILKAQQQSELNAEDSKIRAQDQLHDMRIKRMDWYLDVLSNRRYNTATTQQILEDAWAELDNCSSYAEYDDLYDELKKQEGRIKALPSKIPSDSENAGDEKKSYPDEN